MRYPIWYPLAPGDFLLFVVQELDGGICLQCKIGLSLNAFGDSQMCIRDRCKEREEALSVLEAKADALWEKIEEEILIEIGAAEEENGSLTEAQKEEIRTRIEEENAREMCIRDSVRTGRHNTCAGRA